MVNAVPETGFRTSGTGTSTGNGTAISGTGKLLVWALTNTQKIHKNKQISVFRLCECFFLCTPSYVSLFCLKSGFHHKYKFQNDQNSICVFFVNFYLIYCQINIPRRLLRRR
jgi:hypothetical protein